MTLINNLDNSDKSFLGRFGRTDFDYFKQTFRFQIIDAYDVNVTDTLGTYAEYTETIIDDMEFTTTEVEEEGGLQSVKEYIQAQYSFTKWSSLN
ncbi:hypothetical protein [Erysipelothrix anatis]|uniref:hypothetical protein n=1 Tax=Erysipelothrix anatis TaxID=2683713 RepID=UPI00140D92C1|nr:hypothetical protein [Erysipelothrix anatis]